jgi:penicillin amidase
MSEQVKRKTPFAGWGLLIITTILVYLLDHPLGPLPAIGRLTDPINGCWANAEPVNKDFSAVPAFPQMQHNATVWFDERLVPHIHADNDHDLFFLEGYLHASFRLWQMDMETRAAAGRVSEVVGQKALFFDRTQRRKGMVFAAENSLKAMEAEPRTKLMMDAYTEGINNYIASLSYRAYPLEYKLMGFVPEKWTNLKTSLLLKYMADDLTGKTDDIALTYLRSVLPKAELGLLFPERIEGASPVIPQGTVFEKPSLPVPTAPPDSVAFPHFKSTDFGEKREDGKGSNNWAISGSRTASGAAILCNDPHLGLNLPSLWYEIQLQSPDMNVYGASLPGAPGVIIGFNDSLTWGFTNNYRDVKDFYLIKPVPGNKSKYWFAGKQLDFSKRIERIAVKGSPDFIDTINYTIHGPVMYDDNYKTKDGLNKMLAVCWMAHRATNELLAVYLMNRAKDYSQFAAAILNFQCPAQNIAYADRAGNIAIWGQGQFVNKWKDQGRFVMNGSDSTTLWKELIPMRENPHILNPQQGYISSANQVTTDSTYPYWYNGSGFVNLRAWRIDKLLSGIHKATIQDMFTLQQDTYSLLAANTLPIMLKYLPDTLPVKKWNDMADALRKWDYTLSAESEAATIYQVWWGFVCRDMWSPILSKAIPDHLLPLQERAMQFLQTDIDPARHASVEGYWADIVKNSFNETVDSIMKLEQTTGTEWYKVKNTTVAHLTKLPAFSYDHLKIGGWGNTINAAKGDHGPSWRMVVQMGKEIEAYGVYPGGQSGNPGSKYYAGFLDHWVEGKYYRLQFLPNTDKQNNSTIKYTWTVNH